MYPLRVGLGIGHVFQWWIAELLGFSLVSFPLLSRRTSRCNQSKMWGCRWMKLSQVSGYRQGQQSQRTDCMLSADPYKLYTNRIGIWNVQIIESRDLYPLLFQFRMIQGNCQGSWIAKHCNTAYQIGRYRFGSMPSRKLLERPISYVSRTCLVDCGSFEIERIWLLGYQDEKAKEESSCVLNFRLYLSYTKIVWFQQ